MAAAKKKSSGDESESKPLSKGDLATANSYAAILRWTVETSDRLEAECRRLEPLPDAMRALQQLGAYDALADFALQNQLESRSGCLGHRPYDEVVSHFEGELRRARGRRAKWRRLLAMRKPPEAIYAHMHNIKVADVLDMSSGDVALQCAFEGTVGTPTSYEELQVVSDQWFALAVESVTKVLNSRKDDGLLENAARVLHWAREAWWDYKSEQNIETARRHARSEGTSDRIRDMRRRIAALSDDPRVRDARRGITARGKKGEKSAAYELIALVCERGCTARIIEEAVARQTRGRGAQANHILW